MSETATAATEVDSPDSTEAGSLVNPNISCNRCGTLTTWNPYCPSCGAYLEFSGTPAWHPDEQLSTIPPASAATTATPPTDPTIDATTTADASADTPADASTPTVATTDATTTTQFPADADHPHESGFRHLLTGLFHHGEHDGEGAEKELEHEATMAEEEFEHEVSEAKKYYERELTAAQKELEHEVSEAKADVKGSVHPSEHGVKPWWASWGDQEVLALAADDGPDPAPAAKVMAASGIAPDPEANDGTVFISRRVIPALEIVEPGAELPGLPADDTQKTRAMGNEDLDADGETCTRCDLKNPAGRQYCDWCGTPLPGVTLGPESDAYNPYGLKSSGKVEVSTAPKRSYALKITLLILVLLALIWAIWFFFFGPKAEETRTSLKIVAQQFTEFLAPSSGAQATITNVTASSSLAGTSPMALKSINSRDFWASQTMTLYGVGSTLTFTFQQPYEIDRVAIYPGIQNQTFDVNALATPRIVTIDVGNGKAIQAAVKQVQNNSDYEQILDIPVVITDKVTITIDEVYPPRYPDSSGKTVGEVAVSAIAFLEVPSATTVNPLNTAAPTASASASGSPSASSSAVSSPSPKSSSSAKPKSTPKATASAKSTPTPKATATASATPTNATPTPTN